MRIMQAVTVAAAFGMLVPSLCRAAAEEIPHYPHEASTEVFMLDYTGGLIGRQSDIPYLRVFGDGRVVVRNPYGLDNSSEESVCRISREELDALVLQAVTYHRFFEFDAVAARKAVQQAEEARGVGVALDDFLTTVITLSAQGMTKTHEYYALEFYASGFPEIEMLSRLQMTEQMLSRVGAACQD